MTNTWATTASHDEGRRASPTVPQWATAILAHAGAVPAVAGLLIVLGTVLLRYPDDRDDVGGYLVTLAVGVVLLWMGIGWLQRPAKARQELEDELVQQLARLEPEVPPTATRLPPLAEDEHDGQRPGADHGPVDESGGHPVADE